MRPMRVLIIALEVVLVFVASSAIINYVASRPVPKRDLEEMKFRAVNNAKFQSLLEAGTKNIKNAQYPEALANFQDAEQAVGKLTDDQYTSLKTARRQIASIYEASGRDSEAQPAYKALANSGIQEGEALMKADQFQAALPRLQDGEEFSEHLTDTKRDSLLESRGALVNCFWELQRYSDAVDTTQRMIEYLRILSDPYDPLLTAKYLELVQTYSRENDWTDAEQYLLLAWGECDKRIAHFSGLAGADASLNAALSDKDLTLYWLVTAYQKQGQTDHALATAEEMYTFIAQNSKPWSDLGPYPRKEVAKLALQVASEAKQQEALSLWQKRLATLR